jgi:endonuclease/exonuclease/phosphatase family metal-dependent hydrolase
LRSFIKNILGWINLLFALALIAAYAANYINPVYFWPFAFFGLAYPFLLIINIGFFLFWAWRKKWIMLVSLVAILCGWPNVNRYIQFRNKQHVNITDKYVDILTYNVRLFNYYKWDKRNGIRDSILKFINVHNPGIVCMQDYVTDSRKNETTEKYTDSLLNRFQSKHILYTYRFQETYKYGLATYSQFPIVGRGSIRFNNSNNSCIYSDIKIDTDTIRVYNVHLQSIKFRKNYYYFADSLALHLNTNRIEEIRDISEHLRVAFIKRAEQVDELGQHIQRSPYPVIVCGDFNDTPVSYTYQQIQDRLEDSFIKSGKGIGSTYRGKFPTFRIDYIFNSTELKSFRYQTHRINHSDHYPVSCSLILPEN